MPQRSGSFAARAMSSLASSSRNSSRRDFTTLIFEGIARLNKRRARLIFSDVWWSSVAGLADGAEFPAIELSLSQWHSSDETFYTAIVRDITERSAIMRSLRKTENNSA